VAVGVLCVSALRRHGIDRTRARTAAIAAVLGAAAVLIPTWLAGGSFDVLSASEARRYPEFGEHGDLHFFTSSLLDYLRQNRSGFDLRATGSLLLFAALGLLLARRANRRRLAPEVLAMPVASLVAWGLAQAALFKLYLPHRYTYPLLAFGAITVAVLLRPTWESLGRRGRAAMLVAPLPLAFLAQTAFPLGPMRELGDLPLWLAALAAGAVAAAFVRAPLAAGLVLLAVMVALPGRVPPGQSCPRDAVMSYLSTLPKDAVIAGDPRDLKCVPVSASRPVVISSQLAFSYERGYFLHARARMFDDLRAYYGPSPAALGTLASRYGARYLLVNRRAVRREIAGDHPHWPAGRQPYGTLVTGLLRRGEPAVLHLPARCRSWHRNQYAVYDLRCL
jgi:hypothetical protein